MTGREILFVAVGLCGLLLYLSLRLFFTSIVIYLEHFQVKDEEGEEPFDFEFFCFGVRLFGLAMLAFGLTGWYFGAEYPLQVTLIVAFLVGIVIFVFGCCAAALFKGLSSFIARRITTI